MRSNKRKCIFGGLFRERAFLALVVEVGCMYLGSAGQEAPGKLVHVGEQGVGGPHMLEVHVGLISNALIWGLDTHEQEDHGCGWRKECAPLSQG